MKKILMIIFLFGCIPLLANRLSYYEYWVDDDYANKVGGNINPTVELFELRASYNFANLAPGVHTLNVRCMDTAGVWSVVKGHLFYKPYPKEEVPDISYNNNEIVAYEYWVDDDYANKVSGNTNPQIQTLLLRASYDLTNLVEGVHTLNIRTLDSKGRWSVVKGHLFYKPFPTVPVNDFSYNSNKITAYRSWFDNNPNYVYTSYLKTPVTRFTSNIKILCPNLDLVNKHYIHVQYLDEKGRWSVSKTDSFMLDKFVKGAPSLIAPENNTFADKNTTLEWTEIPFSFKYDLLLATDQTFQNLIIDEEGIENTQFAVNLQMSQTYYWKVKSYYFDEAGEWSEAWKFTTKGPPQIDDLTMKKVSANFVKTENNITSDGGVPITARGICWNKTGNPTTADSKTTDGTGAGIFQSTASNLTKDNTYYFKGYATNSYGTVYTNEIEVQTPDLDIFEIALSSGWNLISSYVEPVEPDSMQYVWNEINDKLVIAKDNAGAVYIPQFGINSLGRWNVKLGYQSYMSQAATLTITGQAVDPATTGVSLKSGWNMVAYLRSTALDAPLAFASITDNGNLVIAKNQAGQVYIPSFGINSLGNLIPGQGYRLYVTNNDTLFYPE